MPRTTRFRIGFAPETVDHLGVVDRKPYRLIEKVIDVQLSYAPEQKTRNRKPVEQSAPFGATWQLRCGPGNRFRVFYEVDDAEQMVWVLAIGIKERGRLWAGEEEFEL